MALLCFRTILMTSQETLQSFTKDPTNLQEIAQKLSADENLDSTSYASVFTQTPNSEQRQAGDMLKRTVSAIYLTLCLKHVGYLNSPGEGDGSLSEPGEEMINIATLLLRHLQGASCNAYGINYVERKAILMDDDEDYESHLKIDEIGGATYSVISTTNHCCNPNAYRINVPGRRCLMKTLREIQSGEEIYDCYGPLYLTEARQERMSKLQTQYLFRCNCLPCTENWPSFGNLRKLPVQYRCTSCHCALKVENESSSKVKCPYCDHVTNIKKVLGGLTVQKERFSLAKTSILAEVFQPFDKDMEAIICEYIKLCQMAYMDPCMVTVEAQEVLKLFWNLSLRNL